MATRINRYVAAVQAHLAQSGISDFNEAQFACLDEARELDRTLEDLHRAATHNADRSAQFAQGIVAEGYVSGNPAGYSTINDLLRLQGEYDARTRSLGVLLRVVFGADAAIAVLNAAKARVQL